MKKWLSRSDMTRGEEEKPGHGTRDWLWHHNSCILEYPDLVLMINPYFAFLYTEIDLRTVNGNLDLFKSVLAWALNLCCAQLLWARSNPDFLHFLETWWIASSIAPQQGTPKLSNSYPFCWKAKYCHLQGFLCPISVTRNRWICSSWDGSKSFSYSLRYGRLEAW